MRKLSTIITLFALGLILFPTLFLHSMFNTPEVAPLSQIMSGTPMNMKLIGKDLQDYLNSPEGLEIRDDWGLQYGPSHQVEPDAFEHGDQAIVLNSALDALANGSFSRALSYLGRHHTEYPNEVKRTFFPLEDELPVSEELKLLYLNYRYNRAVALSSQAQLNSRNGSAVTSLLQESLYDLRRSVNAIETLGEVRGTRGTYWGSGIHAWEGQSLKPEHGGLSASWIYGNLALSYLRLGDKGKYPYRTPEYLERERDKYSWGEDAQLTPIVNELIDYATKGEGRKKISLRFFRLIMALHNLEAAGRGMATGVDSDIHQYTVALILNHLSDYPESAVTLNTAMDFFQKARAASNPSRPIYHMAGKELVLLYWRQGQVSEAMALLESIDLGQLEDHLGGPGRNQNLLFLDLAQLSSLSKGDFDRVRSHLDSRNHDLPNGAVRERHKKVVDMVTDSFFRDLRNRLANESSATWGGVVANFQKDEILQRLPELRNTYERSFLEPSQGDPRVMINLMVRESPSMRIFIRIVSLISLVLWMLYLVWCYRSHRRVAQNLFASRYGQEFS